MNKNKYTLFGCVVLLAIFAAMGASYAPHISGIQDVQRYESIASQVRSAVSPAHTPVESEYPPLASAIFYLTDAVPGVSFANAWIGLIVAALLLTLAYTVVFLKSDDALFLLIACVAAPFLLSKELVFARYDILLMFPLFLAWKAHQRQWFADSAIFLMIAVSIKLVPVLMLPLLLLATPASKRVFIVGGLVVGVLLTLFFPLLLLGIDGFWSNVTYMLSYHGSRGIQIESSWSGIHMLFSNIRGFTDELVTVAMAVNNADMSHGFVLLSTVMTLGGCGVLAWLARIRRTHAPDTASLFLSLILWVLAFAPVLSPQYFVWIVPLLLVHSLTVWRKQRVFAACILAIAIAIGLTTQWIFPKHYGEFLDQRTLSLTVVLVIRNALVLLASLLLARSSLVAFCDTYMRASVLRSYWHALRFRLWCSKISIVCSALFLVLAGAYWVTVPHFDVVQYTYEGQPSALERMPFFVPTQSEYLTVEVSMHLSRIHPTLFLVRPDDCIEEFSINDVRIPSTVIEFCEYGGGKTVNLGQWVREGENRISMRIKDTGGVGGIRIGMSRFDPLFLTYLSLFLVLIFLYTWTLRWIPWVRRHTGLLAIFLGGVLLRISYVCSTPIASRSHDLDGHIEYVQYVLTHWAIPAAQTGWEFHQPPLYYFLAALWVKCLTFFGAGTFAAISLLQIPSLLLSIASLAISVWIALMLFPTRRCAQALFLAVIAIFPALIYVSARVSNDSLAHTLGFLFFALLLSWWKTGSLRQWYVLGFVVAIACLTKVSAAAMCATAGACFLLHPRLSFSRKLLHSAGWLVLIAVVSGWLPVLRLLFEEETSRILMLGNEGMNGALAIPESLRMLATFNPWEVIDITFNNTWSDDYRRQYFWEFFFKSGFFGEYQFDELRRLCQALLVFALLTVPLGIIGFVCRLPTRRSDNPTIPVLLTLIIGLLAAVSYAWKFRYAPNQDFRFSLMILPSLAYCIVLGSERLPWRLARIIARSMIIVFCVTSAVFLLALYTQA